VRSQPVLIQLDALGCFDRARVFFAGVARTPELLALDYQPIWRIRSRMISL
jgi:hypothetical protein